MLDYIRQNSSSWIVKVLLGLICLVFIFFFGASALQAPAQQTSVIAQVDKTVISGRQAQGLVQLIRSSNPTYEQLPASFDEMLLSSAIQVLIDNELVSRSARALGVRIPDQAVSDFVTADPSVSQASLSQVNLAPTIVKDGNLWTNGRFNAEYYNDRYRPGYLNAYGFDYEAEVRAGLARWEIRQAFSQGPVIHEDELKFLDQLQNLKLSVKRVVIDPATLFAETDNQTATDAIDVLEQKNKKIDQLVADLWPLFLKDQLSEEILKSKELTANDLNDISLGQADTLLDGSENISALSQLFALTPESPFPAEPLRDNDKIYFIKLIKKTLVSADQPVGGAPDQDDPSQTDLAQTNQLSGEFAQMIFQQWTETLRKNAEIKINFTPASTPL